VDVEPGELVLRLGPDDDGKPREAQLEVEREEIIRSSRSTSSSWASSWPRSLNVVREHEICAAKDCQRHEVPRLAGKLRHRPSWKEERLLR
jgi:hypothetical protein